MANTATTGFLDSGCLRLGPHGAEHAPGAASTILAELNRALSVMPISSAGTRLFDVGPLAPFLAAAGPVTALARDRLGDDARPVRALLFDKNAQSNWTLAWHQDRVIAVRTQIAADGFTNWTVKGDVPHTTPPWALLSNMLTLRIHLDPVHSDNAPLLVAPGSHRLGFIAQSDIADIVRSCGTAQCLAGAGDIWLYSTPILHASEASRSQRKRRVLQLDYAAFDLPGGLAWRGV